MCDLESQRDEMAVLESIYTCEEEFSYQAPDNEMIKGKFNAFIQLPETFYISYRDVDVEGEELKKLPLKHLPPVTLYFTLPYDYPSKSPPSYQITCPWAPWYMTAKLLDKLDDLWRENEGCVILYIWMNFLKEETLTFLKIGDSHDVSKKYTIQKHKLARQKEMASLDHRTHNPTGNSVPSFVGVLTTDKLSQKEDVKTHYYGRQNSRILDTLPKNMVIVDFLRKYNEDRINTEFQRSLFNCGICFSDKVGFKCFQFKPCGHVYCRDCTRDYFEHRIKDGSVTSMPCPYDKCKCEAQQNEIRELLGPTLYAHYDKLLLNVTLDTMPDITYCPRIGCQIPVMREDDDGMGVCTSCGLAFCIYCKMTYHGIEPCKITSEEKRALVNDYLNSDEDTKKKLELRYGKKQIMGIVQSSMSESWISENSKPCPSCSAAIEKFDGCNKMICLKCCAYFCWLCGVLLNRNAPYEHYSNPESRCKGLLFHGVAMENDFIMNDRYDDEEDEEEEDEEADSEEDMF